MQAFFEDLIGRVRFALAAPGHLFAQSADVRYYWGYIVAAFAILLILKLRGGPAGGSVQRAFAKDTWLSKSALIDIWIFILNPIINLTILSAALLSTITVTDWTADGLSAAGLPRLLSAHGAWAAAGLTVTAFLAADFGKFLAHYLAHRIPALWELHKVHHAAETLNPFTAERFHPLELVVDSVILALCVGAANGLFVALAGPALNPVSIAGANVLWVLANLAGGPIRHLPVWFSYGPKIEHWILSPAQHQIHHSEQERHFDKNMGSTLALWDRLFGTLYVTKGYEPITYGIGAETAQYRTVWANYWRPLQRLAAMAVAALTAKQDAKRAG